QAEQGGGGRAGGHSGRAGGGRGPRIRRPVVPAHGTGRGPHHPAHDQPLPGKPMIEVLSVASEAFPLVKTGGLADVAGALPGAVAAHDVSMRTLIPGYPQVMAGFDRARQVAQFDDLFGGPAVLLAARAGELDVIVINAPHLYGRVGGLYTDESG